MRRLRSLGTMLSAAVLFLVQGSIFLRGQSAPGENAVRLLDHVTAYHALPNGVDIRDGDMREEITALRDDLLRVRISRTDSMPEDASWAVLPEARRGSVSVTPDETGDTIGFHTRALRVEIAKKSMALTVRDANGNVLQQDAKPTRFDGDSFRIYKTMGLDEHFFGLGDRTGPLDRRNEAFTLWNTDANTFQESTDPLYKAIPFFMTFDTGRAVGVLMDNTWRTSFDFGKELSNIYSFGAANGPVDYYLMYGPTPKQVVESYAWLTGKPPLPPLWMLGFQQSRYSYYPQARVMEVANRLRADRIPADALYLDIDYQDRNRPFTVDRKLFPDFEGMIKDLKEKNFHLVLITDLHIANAPSQNYASYDSGMAGDHFVKNPDGSVFTGIVWPGPSVFPDFTQEQTRAWWGSLYKEFVKDGAAGFWNDMNEPSVFNTPTKTIPEDVIHRIDEPGFAKRTATHAEIHNVFGMQNSRATYEGLLKLDPNTRPFVLTRATYAGGQRYAATWTGDNSSTWNHLRLTTPMIENLGLSGFAFTGADVGGFVGTPMPDLLTKWIEVSAFQPIDRDHTEKGSGDQEPWVGGPAQEAIRKRFIEERYRLLPYFYTLADETSRTGLPMMRSLFLEFPEAMPDRHPIDIDAAASSEFLLGPDLLIAPPRFPDELDSYMVEFPSSDWYDYWTGKKVKNPSAFKVKPELSTLPVFVRAGAILPIQPLIQSTNETPQGPLTLRVYPGASKAPCEGSLYLDDGKTFGYQNGEYLRMKFGCEVTSGGVRLHIGAHEGTYPAWWKLIRAEVYGLPPKPMHASAASHNLPVTRSAEYVAFTVQDDGKGLDIDLR